MGHFCAAGQAVPRRLHDALAWSSRDGAQEPPQPLIPPPGSSKEEPSHLSQRLQTTISTLSSHSEMDASVGSGGAQAQANPGCRCCEKWEDVGS